MLIHQHSDESSESHRSGAEVVRGIVFTFDYTTTLFTLCHWNCWGSSAQSFFFDLHGGYKSGFAYELWEFYPNEECRALRIISLGFSFPPCLTEQTLRRPTHPTTRRQMLFSPAPVQYRIPHQRRAVSPSHAHRRLLVSFI